MVIKQKIDGTTIKINRGDKLEFSLSIQTDEGTQYTFQQGDKVVFSIYNKNKMNDKAVLLKEVEATPNTTSLTISCTSEETKIGDLINKQIEYWYEIELNNEYTILGYDEEGAKKLILFPEGSKVQ